MSAARRAAVFVDAHDPARAFGLHEAFHALTPGTAAATDWKVMVDAATATGRLRRSDIASISYRALKNYRELLSEASALGLLEGCNALPAPVL